MGVFIDNLIDKIKEKNNYSVLGLDPRVEYIPKYIIDKHYASCGYSIEAVTCAMFEFNQRIIDVVYDIIPCVKLQLACYEMYGPQGITLFDKTVKYAKQKGLLVIADGKRNDIGSSAKCYSSAYLGETKINNDIYQPIFDVDAITVNPYLGFDGIEPFIEDCKMYGKGIFVLVKTSNKSSYEIQDLITSNGESVFQVVANYVNSWGQQSVGKYGYSNIGAVVGATYPKQAKSIRNILKSAYILVPGYGAQGGTAQDVVNNLNSDGLGAIVNASRSLMCAYKNIDCSEEEFTKAVREEALRMRDDLNSIIKFPVGDVIKKEGNNV